MRSTLSESTRTKRRTEDDGISHWNLFLTENRSRVWLLRLLALHAWVQLWCGANGRSLKAHLAQHLLVPVVLWWFADPLRHMKPPPPAAPGPHGVGLPHIGSSCEGEVSVEVCVAQRQAENTCYTFNNPSQDSHNLPDANPEVHHSS